MTKGGGKGGERALTRIGVRANGGGGKKVQGRYLARRAEYAMNAVCGVGKEEKL